MASSSVVLKKILEGTTAAKCETETLDFKQAKPNLKEAFQDLAEDLVGRELLTRTSEQTRGPAVRYGPGPGFPSSKGRRSQKSSRPSGGG
jgi:hypothetical protein